MLKNKKTKIRILPILIFMAVLTLSIKVNNVFDLYNHQIKQKVSISTAQALAEEELNQETAALSNVLRNGTPENDQADSSAPNTAFTQSEIMILQELLTKHSQKYLFMKMLKV